MKPIGVVDEETHDGLTVPIPTQHGLGAMMHNVAIAAPTPKKAPFMWRRFAIGIAAGVATVVGIVVALS